MNYENRLAVQVSLYTGLRLGDVLKSTPADLVGNKLHYVAEKTGKQGTASLSRALAEKLRKNANNYWLFPSPYKYGIKHRHRSTVYKDFIDARERAKIDENVTPHSARKTFAVETRDKKGFDEVKKALQHDNIGTTMLYALSDYKQPKNGEKIDYDVLAGKVALEVARLLIPELKQMFGNP
ncbi:MAG: tyrosine-type recombinase/integrase [Bacteroidaceae bacterium]|nr:tyrosine-type recombinase/integrase [Bacteroidaceae bacterium]